VSVIGARIPQLRWEAITSGVERYAGDIRLDRMLLGGVLRSPLPHAEIKSIDTSQALAVPGVHAVITAADLPADALYIHHGGPLADRPPLARDVVRFVGQEVAAVAAETEDALRSALAVIDVRYRRLAATTVLGDARRRSRPLHDRDTAESGLAVAMTRRWGDLARARAREAVAVEARFSYPRIAHTCLEPNTTVARWDPEQERLELWTSTQAPYFVVKEVASALGLDQAQVVCREVAVGGGFGSKSKISEHEVVVAALARRAGRPVLLALTREEEFSTTKTRHRFEVGLRMSADEGGALCAVEATVDVENGAYNHSGPSVLASGVRSFGTLYEPIGVAIDGRLIDTAIQPGGQFRGYGNPQVTFAIESLVDDLAGELGIDPVTFRLRNANRPDTTTLSGARIKTSRLAECIERAHTEIGWVTKRRNRRRGRGVGLAVAMQGSGYYTYEGANRSEATVDVDEDGAVTVRFGGADPGTGQRTVLAQVAAEALGVDPGEVVVEMMDSETTPFDMGAWSSRGTQMGGQAVAAAAGRLADRIRELGRQKLGTEVSLCDGKVVADDGGSTSLGDLVRTSSGASDGHLSVTADYVVPDVEMPGRDKAHVNMSASYAFAAHAVEVDVDERTGEIHVIDYVAVHDCGAVINPILAEGQVIGGVVMGLGAALGEEVIHEAGRIVNPAFVNYAVPRAADAPPVRVVLLDAHEPAGPHGAKSIGELPVVPPAPAVANAVFDAVGVRIRDLPITPDKVLGALRAQRDGGVEVRPAWRRPGRWFIGAMRWGYPRGVLQLLDRVGTRFARRDGARPSTLVAPTQINEVSRALADGEVVAGGTDVLPRAKQGLAHGETLVSLHRLPQLRTVELPEDGSIRLGATVTLSEAARALRDDVPVLAETIETIASPQIRNMATVAGNLLQEKRCWFFRNGFVCYKRGGSTCPCYAVEGDHRFYHAAMGAHRCQAVTPSDLATTLLALDASVRVLDARGQDRQVSIDELYVGPGETVLARDDLVTAVVLPAEARRRIAAFEKVRLWQGDFAVVSACISWLPPPRGAAGSPSEVRVVFGSLAPVPWRARGTERAIGEGADHVAALRRELGRIAHPLRRNRWKLDAAAGLVERAMERLATEES